MKTAFFVYCALLFPFAILTAGETTPPLPIFLDVPYASKSASEKMDLYLPADAGSTGAPLVVWIHGGGFTVGDKRSLPRRDQAVPPKPGGRFGPYQIQVPDLTALLAKGYAVVSLNYRLGHSMFEAALPAVQDGKAAIRFLRANAGRYQIDPSKIAVCGNSAGGYMAAMIGVTGDQSTDFDDFALGGAGVSSAVQAVVVWYGAEDRFPDPKFLPRTYIRSAQKLPSFRIVSGDADPIISPDQSKRLNQMLLEFGAKTTVTILAGAGHEDPAFMGTQMAPTLQFLDEALGVSGAKGLTRHFLEPTTAVVAHH